MRRERLVGFLERVVVCGLLKLKIAQRVGCRIDAVPTMVAMKMLEMRREVLSAVVLEGGRGKGERRGNGGRHLGRPIVEGRHLRGGGRGGGVCELGVVVLGTLGGYLEEAEVLAALILTQQACCLRRGLGGSTATPSRVGACIVASRSAHRFRVL